MAQSSVMSNPVAARWSPGSIGRRGSATPASPGPSAARRPGSGASRLLGRRHVSVVPSSARHGPTTSASIPATPNAASARMSSAASVVSARPRRRGLHSRSQVALLRADAVSDPAAADAADAEADTTGEAREGSEYDQTGEHEFNLPELTPSSRENRFDLIVVGCGPAGLSAADRASAKGLRVALVDPRPLSLWRNNYGVWVDEFEDLGRGGRPWPLHLFN